MQLAHRVALGGAQLDEIDPRIIIKGVEGGAGKETVTAVSLGRGDGTRITGKRRESVEVAVKFSMNIRRNLIEERAAVLEAIGAWAAPGGWLTINYKPDRRLWVDEVVVPGEGDLWKRLSEYTITFRARAVPYWQTTNTSSARTGSATSGSGTIQVPGSAETVCDCTLENLSGATVNSASITIGENTMTFDSLALGAGASLKIDHITAQGIPVIRIRAGGSNAMAKRSGADDFAVNPGDVNISFSAQRACRLTVSCRGRFV